MSQDEKPKQKWPQTWLSNNLPMYWLLLGVIGGIVIATLTLLGQTTGNVFSNIYSTDPFCFGEVTAKAWLDKNADGKEDADEPPLPNVEFSFDDRKAQSNEYGEASSGTISTQCVSQTVVVSATPPSGYRLTTEGVVTTTIYDRTRGPLLFGFVRISINSTPTPPSTSP